MKISNFNGIAGHNFTHLNHTFTLNNLDTLKALFYTHIRSKVIWGMCIFPGSIKQIAIVLGFIVIERSPVEIAIAVSQLVTWAFMLNITGYLLISIGLMINTKWRNRRTGEHILLDSSDGLLITINNKQSLIAWKSIRHIVLGRSLIYIAHSRRKILAIPKHSFADIEDWIAYSVKLKNTWLDSVMHNGK
jgi:hypothetical protein